MRVRSLGIALVLAGLVTACGDTTATEGPFLITVGSGLTPTYTWESGPALSLTVSRAATPDTPVWSLVHPEAALGSPVVHGTVGFGAVEVVATERTLTPGVRYRVTVTMAEGVRSWTEFSR